MEQLMHLALLCTMQPIFMPYVFITLKSLTNQYPRTLLFIYLFIFRPRVFDLSTGQYC